MNPPITKKQFPIINIYVFIKNISNKYLCSLTLLSKISLTLYRFTSQWTHLPIVTIVTKIILLSSLFRSVSRLVGYKSHPDSFPAPRWTPPGWGTPPSAAGLPHQAAAWPSTRPGSTVCGRAGPGWWPPGIGHQASNGPPGEGRSWNCQKWISILKRLSLV